MPNTLEEALALLAQCNPPGYVVEPAPRCHDKEWFWDSCDDDYDGSGDAHSEDEARAAAWEHFKMAEAERATDDRSPRCR